MSILLVWAMLLLAVSVLLRAESFVFSYAFWVGFLQTFDRPCWIGLDGHRMETKSRGIFFGSKLSLGALRRPDDRGANGKAKLVWSFGRLVLEMRAEGACDPAGWAMTRIRRLT